MDQSFNLSLSGKCTDNEKPIPEAPVLDSGMIPVTIANNGTVTTIASNDSDWYDYDNKEWANVVLVDDDSRSTYKNTTGKTVNQDDILAYYVWIPRYSYRIPRVFETPEVPEVFEIKCSTLDNPNVEENPECYKYNVSEDDKEILINVWYSILVEGQGIDYTLEQAAIDVENALQTGVFSTEGIILVSTYEFLEAYKLEIDSNFTYDMEFAPNNSIFNDNPTEDNTTEDNTPIEIDIQFEAKTSQMVYGDAVETYRTHPAFWWDNNSNGIVETGETKAGIWVGKFETSAEISSTCYTSENETNCSSVNPRILPNVSSLRYQNVSTQFTTSRKFSANGNTYGLSNSSTDAHMMKNSEWGAVAYLSHSKYGINSEIRINNNYNYTTGCGASTENGDSTPICEIAYGGATSYPQSTTGNITGIFDMSGGAFECVMGVHADSNGKPMSGYSSSSNSGFNGTLSDDISYTSGINFPENKYFDLHTLGNSTIECNGGICYGHALSETAKWYGDYADFVHLDHPWSMRGGYNSSFSSAGAFGLLGDNGNAERYNSWRSVLVG